MRAIAGALVILGIMLCGPVVHALRITRAGARGYRFSARKCQKSPELANELPDRFQSSFMETMRQRGFIHQCTNFQSLDNYLQKPSVAYLGFDATARSLHVGSLMQIMILRTFQRAGHKPIVLIGGGTTKVGDPSGKDESRQVLTEDAIKDNMASLSRVFHRYLKFGNGPTDAVMVNNADWLDEIKYLSFLREYGSYFTINRMLTMDSVKNRLAREQPLTFLEFNYMLLQAYDFVELHRRYKASLQLGGSDQWGNIVSGVELGRKMGVGPLYGLTSPLVTTSDGRKMGKTAAGAVWLDRELLSEYDYWQFWRNTADADVIRFLKLFTDLPMERIAKFERLSGAELNAAKIVLADEATRMLHGEDCLAGIHQTVQGLFTTVTTGSADALESLPQVQLTGSDFSSNGEAAESRSVSVVDLLVKAGFATSKNAARRLIALGGARVNDVAVTDERAEVLWSEFDSRGRLKLSGSKKKHAVILAPVD